MPTRIKRGSADNEILLVSEVQLDQGKADVVARACIPEAGCDPSRNVTVDLKLGAIDDLVLVPGTEGAVVGIADNKLFMCDDIFIAYFEDPCPCDTWECEAPDVWRNWEMAFDVTEAVCASSNFECPHKYAAPDTVTRLRWEFIFGKWNGEGRMDDRIGDPQPFTPQTVLVPCDPNPWTDACTVTSLILPDGTANLDSLTVLGDRLLLPDKE